MTIRKTTRQKPKQKPDNNSRKNSEDIDRIYSGEEPLIVEPDELADQLSQEPEQFTAPEPDPELDGEEQTATSNSERKQFKGFELEAGALMLIIDAGFGMIGGFIDRSYDYERYTLQEERRKLLSSHLSEMMESWQTKFGPEFYFYGLIAVSYLPLMLLAFKNRKPKNTKIIEEKS